MCTSSAERGERVMLKMCVGVGGRGGGGEGELCVCR